MLITLALIAWTTAVSPRSAYGDVWAIAPALAAFPLVVLWHVAMIISLHGHRRAAAAIAVCHIALLAPIWMWSLIGISKDSL